MDIVRVDNVWNLHFLKPKFEQMGAVATKIVWQELDKPILPSHFDSLTKEYIDIYIADTGKVRFALFVEVESAKQRCELRSFTMSVYDNVRFETI